MNTRTHQVHDRRSFLELCTRLDLRSTDWSRDPDTGVLFTHCFDARGGELVRHVVTMRLDRGAGGAQKSADQGLMA